MKQLIVATKNEGKANEFKTMFKPYGIEAVSLLDLPEEVPDIEETGETFFENAALKAEVTAENMNIPVLADDSGLLINALGGKPGVYTARYAGFPKSDQKNMAKVLNEMAGIGQVERKATFVTVLAVAVPNKETLFYEGKCSGHIAEAKFGDQGFGYDPIFIPAGYQKTMAELEPAEKNKISHRRQAIKELEKDMNMLIAYITE